MPINEYIPKMTILTISAIIFVEKFREKVPQKDDKSLPKNTGFVTPPGIPPLVNFRCPCIFTSE